MSLDEEEQLPAGRITHGVVRVGDTVRRPSNASSPFVSRLLARLEGAGCAWAPRYLGQDEQGRDTLTFLPGHVPLRWVHFSDAQIRAAALIVRELHEVTRDGDGVVCHHDAGPNNFVFRDDVPVALIDFDMAALGDPLEDVAYMAWSWCLSTKPSRGPIAAQAAQVRVVADAFELGASDRQRLPAQIVERLARNTRFWTERLGEPGSTLKNPKQTREMIDWSERERTYIQAQQSELVAALR